MRFAIVVGALAAATVMPASLSAQAGPPAAGTTLGTVTLAQRVQADGGALAAGDYQVRLTGDSPSPVVGLSPDGSRYVEFLRGGKVVGRALATIISNADLPQVADGPRPATGGSRVDLLKGNDYIRVWINRGGSNYLIHLPRATT
jgi:hypothetical protein